MPETGSTPQNMSRMKVTALCTMSGRFTTLHSTKKEGAQLKNRPPPSAADRLPRWKSGYQITKNANKPYSSRQSYSFWLKNTLHPSKQGYEAVRELLGMSPLKRTGEGMYTYA